MRARIDLADVQGDILRAHGNRYQHTSYLFLGLGDAEAGRRWLSGLIPRVTTDAWRGGERPTTALNVAFTCAGLEALGVPHEVLGSFSHEFRSGMAARARELGDTGPSAPETWDAGLGTGAAHVLLTVNATGEEVLGEALRALEEGLETAGMSILHTEHAHLLDIDAREHFGFADGAAQPAVEYVSEHKKNGGGVPEKDGSWRPLALGEFLHGYEDEESRTVRNPRKRVPPSAPSGPLGRNGTYMVWRKLHQDVALFRRTLRDAATLYPGGEELLAAKLVGRWRDGTPLVTVPGRTAGAFDPAEAGSNDFRYGRDRDGMRCPLGAHIRRANPRDALDPEPDPETGFGDGRLTFRHRIIRRGMPYGDPLPDGIFDDDGKPRGLVFVCFNASLSRQFESVQRQWLNDGNVFRLAHDSDYLLGANDPDGGKMTVEGDPPFIIEPQPPFVITRGGEYLFAPGITGLAAIADGVTG
jgi:Dyp-type peroxidase family